MVIQRVYTKGIWNLKCFSLPWGWSFRREGDWFSNFELRFKFWVCSLSPKVGFKIWVQFLGFLILAIKCIHYLENNYFKIQSPYYSMRAGPLICSSCCVELGPEANTKYNNLLISNRNVVPCCDSLACQAQAPTFTDGWLLRSKPKKRKASNELPNPPQSPRSPRT